MAITSGGKPVRSEQSQSPPEQPLSQGRPTRPEPRDNRPGFADRAIERLQNLVRDLDQGGSPREGSPERQRPPEPVAAPPVAKNQPASDAPALTLEGFNWLPVAAAGAVLLLLLLSLPTVRMLQRRIAPGGGPSASGPLAIQLVRTREDLVRAFDRLALTCCSAVKPWWNHRQVERELVRRANAAKVTELVQVYELARYQSEHEPLSELQLATARTLLQECSSSSARSR